MKMRGRGVLVKKMDKEVRDKGRDRSKERGGKGKEIKGKETREGKVECANKGKMERNSAIAGDRNE